MHSLNGVKIVFPKKSLKKVYPSLNNISKNGCRIIFITAAYDRENTISDVVNDYFATGHIN